MSERELVILSAFSCAPRRGSESEVGWQAVETVRGVYDALVLVDEGYRESFEEEELAALRAEGIEICFLGVGGLLGWLFRDGMQRRKIYYSLWQRRVPGRVRELLRGREAVLAHHVTWAKHSVPTLLNRLEIPVMIGPVGGGEVSPKGLLGGLRFWDRLSERARGWGMALARRNRALRRSVRGARIVYAATEETAAELRRIAPGSEVRIRSQVSAEPPREMGAGAGEVFRMVSTGRLVGLKGFWLVMEAFYEASERVGEFVIVGDGPERERLEERAKELARPGKQVIFKGWLEREEAQRELQKAHVFCFGSLHDSAGFAVLEALGAGLPVVCVAAGGPAELVTEECGIRIAPTSVAGTSKMLAEALDRLEGDRELCRRLGAGARERAREFEPAAVKAAVLADYRALAALKGGGKGAGF